MSEIAVIGSSEFALGFQLAGIRNVVELGENENPSEKIKELTCKPEISIIVTEENLMKKVSEDERMKLEALIKPVIVVLSRELAAENLRKSIIKAIGVDLWREG